MGKLLNRFIHSFYWFSFANKEFFTQFLPRKNDGNRDFFWLTTLLCLLVLFALLLLGTREGFSEKLVELLLGRVPGKGGIPVWVRSNPGSIGGKNLINQDVIHKIHLTKNLSFYPYREVDNFMIELTNKNIWKPAHSFIEAPKFRGIAVYKNDPLWQYAIPKEKEDTPFRLIMSRSIIKSNFNYHIYKQSLRNIIPKSLWLEIPDIKKFYSSQSSFMWLKVGPKKDLLKIPIIWVERIPVPGNIVFLFPLSHFHCLNVSYNYPKIEYFPESFIDKQSRRVKIVAVENSISDDQIKQLKHCLNASYDERYGRLIFRLKKNKPEYIVSACAESSGISADLFKVAQYVNADNISQMSWNINIPCRKVPDHILEMNEFDACTDNKKFMISRKIDGFIRGFVYLKNRNDLSDAVHQLKNIENNPLLIPWIYGDALRRFGALIYLIDIISKPFVVFFCIFLSSLLFVQIATLISHRRHNYGIFLSKGISHLDIYMIVFYQITIALTIGTGVAYGCYIAIRNWLNEKLIVASQLFSDVLTLETPDLLSIKTVNIVICFGLELLISWLIVIIILYYMPLKKKTMPGDLL